jgi:hypothetical protein
MVGMALRQLAFQQARGVMFDLRFDLGMTHSVYIHDPDGYGHRAAVRAAARGMEERHRGRAFD